MNGKELFDKMSGVSPELVQKAEERQGRARSMTWKRWCAAAAVICLVAAAVLLPDWGDMRGVRVPQEPLTLSASDLILPDESAVIIDGGEYVGADSQSACYKAPDAGTAAQTIELRAAMEDYESSGALLFVALDVFYESGTTVDFDAELERMRSLGYDVFFAQMRSYESESYTFLAGLFTAEQIKNFRPSESFGYFFRFAQNGDGSPVEPNRVGGDGAGWSMQAIPRELTLEEAYERAGDYLPPRAPEGFELESAYLHGDSLTLLWSKGYNELRWTVSPYTGDCDARLTSIASKENYDMSLYPIPRADSVPESLREIVENPIFDRAELNLEAVRARSYKVNDSGDSNGLRMSFGVRVGDTLIELTSKGVSPEWIFAALPED